MINATSLPALIAALNNVLPEQNKIKLTPEEAMSLLPEGIRAVIEKTPDIAVSGGGVQTNTALPTPLRTNDGPAPT